MLIRLLWWLLIVFPGVALAQVIEIGESFVATAVAVTPGCTVSDGGADVTNATALCDAQGYTAAGTAQASLNSSETGGDVFAFAEAAATSTGSISNLTATGSGDGAAVVTWLMQSSTHYSRSIAISDGASASFSSDISGPLGPSGIVPGDFYTLRANASALAQAQDINGVESVTDGPRDASMRIVFAVVGSITLIRGTVLADGEGIPGLLIEAMGNESNGSEGNGNQAIVASTLTGDDGSYLLPNLAGTVTLRISDPQGMFLTQVSDPLTPPTSFNTNLLPGIFADSFE